MKRVLVTGGSGFIGSHLCEFLLKKRYEVICIDNNFTGSKENILYLIENPYFEFIRHDVIEPFRVEVDEIYNLACPASPVHYQFNPVETIKTNVSGTLNALGLANRIKAKMLQASTSEVYGDPLEHPQKESYNGNVSTLSPRSCYDEGKRVAESLCYAYKLQDKVDIKIARIFNTYGPRMSLNDGRVVSNFIVQALQDKPITIYGDGAQTRSFCYVSELVEGLFKLMNKQSFMGPVNLGNPGEFTIKQLAELIIDLIGSKSEIKYISLPEGDPIKRKPDITLAKKELEWEPKISLVEGLRKTIPYFEEKLRLRATNQVGLINVGLN